MSQKSSISLPSGRYEIRALADGSFMSDQTLTGFRAALDEHVVTNKYDPFEVCPFDLCCSVGTDTYDSVGCSLC